MSSPFFTKLKVGFTTLLAVIILFGGVLWVKRYNPATKKIRITVVFDNGRDLNRGDPVQMSGIQIGEVTHVSLSEDNKARVKFYINYIKLSPDCSFIIEDVGLMGDKALVIIPGKESGELNPDIIHKGIEGTDLGSLISNADEILQKLNSISGKIDSDFDIAKLSNDFKQTLDKFQEVITTYNILAIENKEPLEKSIRNLEASTQQLKNFIEKNDNILEQAIGSFRHASDRLSIFIEDMQNLSSVIDTISAYVDSGEGTFARLLKYDDLYEEIRQTNANIDSFITDFKRNPGKYTKDIKFKIRLF